MTPSHAQASVRTSAKRRQGHMQAEYRAVKVGMSRVPTLLAMTEGHIPAAANARSTETLRGRQTSCMHGILLHGNREIPRPSRATAQDRIGKA